MKRRKIIKSGIYITGYAFLIGSALTSISSCKKESADSTGWEPGFFTIEEAILVAHVAESIIPKTDTPGAKDALVHQFIDENIRLNLTADQQSLFKQGLQLFNDVAEDKYGKDFIDLSEEDKYEVLLFLDQQAEENDKKGNPHIFKVMKDMTKFGYFTSEVGAKEFLIFDQIPGAYIGCIDYSEVGGTWAI
jgi:hypothetical protein